MARRNCASALSQCDSFERPIARRTDRAVADESDRGRLGRATVVVAAHRALYIGPLEYFRLAGLLHSAHKDEHQ